MNKNFKNVFDVFRSSDFILEAGLKGKEDKEGTCQEK